MKDFMVFTLVGVTINQIMNAFVICNVYSSYLLKNSQKHTVIKRQICHLRSWVPMHISFSLTFWPSFKIISCISGINRNKIIKESSTHRKNLTTNYHKCHFNILKSDFFLVLSFKYGWYRRITSTFSSLSYFERELCILRCESNSQPTWAFSSHAAPYHHRGRKFNQTF